MIPISPLDRLKRASSLAENDEEYESDENSSVESGDGSPSTINNDDSRFSFAMTVTDTDATEVKAPDKETAT